MSRAHVLGHLHRELVAYDLGRGQAEFGLGGGDECPVCSAIDGRRGRHNSHHVFLRDYRVGWDE